MVNRQVLSGFTSKASVAIEVEDRCPEPARQMSISQFPLSYRSLLALVVDVFRVSVCPVSIVLSEPLWVLSLPCIDPLGLTLLTKVLPTVLHPLVFC